MKSSTGVIAGTAVAEQPIPYVDLASQNSLLWDDLRQAFEEVVRGGRLILGDAVGAFENDMARFHGTRWSVGVNSGTDALILSLLALGIGNGDEVITVSNTFVATVASIQHVGARPVLVDVDDGMTMDPAALDAAITPRTRAVIPVHLHGRPARMREIMDIATRRGIWVVEDAAQAIGARLADRLVGTFGELACFSLHPLKNLGALGDAGLIVGRDEALLDHLKLLRNHGLRSRDMCEVWGFNSRLDSIHAALLRVKLPKLHAWTEARRRIADEYLQSFVDLPLALPVERPGEHSVWHGFVVQCAERDRLRDHLAALGIEALVYYPVPIHLQPASRALGYGPGSLPVTEAQARTILSLPVRHDLRPNEVKRIVAGVRSFFCAEVG